MTIAQRNLSLTLSVRELNYALELVSDQARNAMRDAMNDFARLSVLRRNAGPSSPQSDTLKNLKRAIKLYNKLANDADYLLMTRTPILEPDAKLELQNSPVKHHLVAILYHKKTKMRPEALDDLAGMSEWFFENCRHAMDRIIAPSWELQRMVKRFGQGLTLKTMLAGQPRDERAKTAAIEALDETPYGSELLQLGAQHGYDYYFVDLGLYQRYVWDLTHGKTKSTPSAVCSSEMYIFVDTYRPVGDAHRAIKLAHELGHVDQLHGHFQVRRYEAGAPRNGFLGSLDCYSSTLRNPSRCHRIYHRRVVARRRLSGRRCVWRPRLRRAGQDCKFFDG